MAELLLLAVAMVWGTSYGLAKLALAYYPLLGFLATRFCLTFALTLPALLRDLKRHPYALLRAGLPLGALLLGIFLCETSGVARTSASNAAFLVSLCVVLTPFVEWLLMGQRPSGSALLAALLSLCGALMLTGGLSLQLNGGDMLMLAAALLRAITVCLTKRLTAGQPVSTLGLTSLQTGVVGIGCLLLAAAQPTPLPPLPHATPFWLITAYLVLCCTLFAFYALNWGIRHSTPTRVALLTGSEPLFGALFAVLWLGEQLTAQAMLGGLLITAASLWAALPRPAPAQAVAAAG
ncbi:DMT family transporter [Chitinivorax sp. PXF-14]|uniref:DMT family transporter n=1 Tax=Chitinivorax sp. PXF-14 TaxID=3230488 RepID=UPI0034670EDD